MKEALSAGLARLGIPLSAEVQARLCAFGEAVIEKNRVMNLTAITEPAQVAELHLLDSLTLLKAEPLAGKRVLDVGTGAGFPGVPLKIAEPSIRLTLLDSLQKRMRWLETEALPALGVEAEVLAARAEDAVKTRREQFDVVTSRAVARLNVLCELCLPFVKGDGLFLAMKGPELEAELKEARGAIGELGAQVLRIERFSVGSAEHSVLVLQKIAATPPEYPRPFSQIRKKPLQGRPPM